MKKLLFLSTLLLFGCANYLQHRDIKKLDALSIQQPTEFLRLSALINPCFMGKAKSDTVITAGKPDTILQKGDTTIVIKHDTVIKTVTNTRIIYQPTLKTIHDTVPDTRAIASLQAQLKDCSTGQTTAAIQLQDARSHAQKLLWWVIGLSCAILIFSVIKVYSFFTGGAIIKTAEKII